MALEIHEYGPLHLHKLHVLLNGGFPTSLHNQEIQPDPPLVNQDFRIIGLKTSTIPVLRSILFHVNSYFSYIYVHTIFLSSRNIRLQALLLLFLTTYSLSFLLVLTFSLLKDLKLSRRRAIRSKRHNEDLSKTCHSVEEAQ